MHHIYWVLPIDARHCAKCIIYSIQFDPHHNLERWAPKLSSSQEDSEKLSYLPKATKLAPEQKFEPLTVWLQSHCSSPLHCFPCLSLWVPPFLSPSLSLWKIAYALYLLWKLLESFTLSSYSLNTPYPQSTPWYCSFLYYRRERKRGRGS